MVDLIDDEEKAVFAEIFGLKELDVPVEIYFWVKGRSRREAMHELYEKFPGLEMQDRFTEAYHNGAETGCMISGSSAFVIFRNNWYYFKSHHDCFVKLEKGRKLEVWSRVYLRERKKHRGFFLMEELTSNL